MRRGDAVFACPILARLLAISIPAVFRSGADAERVVVNFQIARFAVARLAVAIGIALRSNREYGGRGDEAREK